MISKLLRSRTHTLLSNSLKCSSEFDAEFYKNCTEVSESAQIIMFEFLMYVLVHTMKKYVCNLEFYGFLKVVNVKNLVTF